MSEWLGIDSAPKDGTWVLLAGGSIDYGWDGGAQPPVVVAQFIGAAAYLDEKRWQFAWYDGGYYGEYKQPTHWMPTPCQVT